MVEVNRSGPAVSGGASRLVWCVPALVDMSLGLVGLCPPQWLDRLKCISALFGSYDGCSGTCMTLK